MSAVGPELSHQEIQELLGAYALDATDKETALVIERHLDECLRCSIEVAQHHEVAGLLANSGGTSPADLWDGIASRLDGSGPPSWEGLAGRLETGEEREVVPVDETGTGEATVIPMGTHERGRVPNRWAMRVGAIAAAAALVAAVAFGLEANHLHGQVNALQSRPSLSAVERAALQAPSTQVVNMRAGAGATAAPTHGAVTVVLTRSGTGFVEAGNLSALPNDRTYQLWGVIAGRAISLGLLGSSPGVVPFSVAGHVSVAGFAITAEHGGGVITTTNAPVVAGTVT